MGTDVAISTPSVRQTERWKDEGFLFNEEEEGFRQALPRSVRSYSCDGTRGVRVQKMKKEFLCCFTTATETLNYLEVLERFVVPAETSQHRLNTPNNRCENSPAGLGSVR